MEISLRYTWLGERLDNTQFWWAVAGAIAFVVVFFVVMPILVTLEAKKKK